MASAIFLALVAGKDVRAGVAFAAIKSDLSRGTTDFIKSPGEPLPSGGGRIGAARGARGRA